jgi:hypothetical protein
MFVAVATVVMAGSAAADTLLIETLTPADSGLPSAGISKDRVAASWGEPANKVAAVGEPPISRWVYDEFVVYFEFDRVIHTVAKR